MTRNAQIWTESTRAGRGGAPTGQKCSFVTITRTVSPSTLPKTISSWTDFSNVNTPSKSCVWTLGAPKAQIVEITGREITDIYPFKQKTSRVFHVESCSFESITYLYVQFINCKKERENEELAKRRSAEIDNSKGSGRSESISPVKNQSMSGNSLFQIGSLHNCPTADKN